MIRKREGGKEQEKEAPKPKKKTRLKITSVGSHVNNREFKKRRRRRLGKRRLKNELVFLLQISRMAGCIQTA